MDFDWRNPPDLPAPRRRRMLSERVDREKLARSKMRRSKGNKNHSVNKDRSHEQRKKHRLNVKAVLEKKSKFRNYFEAVRAYWLGEAENHPEKPV